jgi:outer membrane receptor for ferrienterochelin and colicin
MKLVAVRQLESSLTEYDVVAGESITDDDLGQLSIPKWQANLTTTYTEGNFSASWTYKFKQGGRLDQDASEEYRDTDNPGNSNVHNIRASYNLTDEANVYVGVNNVTNHSGLDHWTTSYGTRNGWSILGRSYYAGVIYNF